MSENLRTFLKRVSADKALIERLNAATDYEQIFALAGELGIALTIADIEGDDGEISESELEAITGGGCVCLLAGGGIQDDSFPGGCACIRLGHGSGDEGWDRD